jgi:hypothetical protein
MEPETCTLSDEDALREQLRIQADEAEKKETAERNRSKNLTRPTEETLERDARKEIPKIYREMEDKSRALTEENKDLRRQIENITENLLKKNNGTPVDMSKFDGGPTNDAHANLGGAVSSRYIKHAIAKFTSGEWDEEDIERYLFADAGWIDKAHVRTQQIIHLFHRKKPTAKKD